MSILALLVQLSAHLRARDWAAATATFVELLEALIKPQPGPDPAFAAAFSQGPAKTFKDKEADKLADAIDAFVAAQGGVPPGGTAAGLGGRFDWMGLLTKLLPLILGFFG